MNRSLHSGYKIVYSINDYEPEEKLFLRQWVRYKYIEVRDCYYKGGQNSIYENMIRKYDSRHDKESPIYRGLKFDKTNIDHKNTFDDLKEYYIDCFNDNKSCEIDFAPTSFTTTERIAQHFAMFGDPTYCSILLKIIIRKGNEIDACSKEAVMNSVNVGEDELILPMHIRKYYVDDILSYCDDILIVSLKEAL